MSKDMDNFTPEEEYALEEILAEFTSRKPKEGSDPVPSKEPTLSEQPPRRAARPTPPPKPSQPPENDKVILFPGTEHLPEPEPPSFLEEGLENLRRKADDFADHMFENEGVETSDETLRAETLIPGVDEEKQTPQKGGRRRKQAPLPPDVPPAQLFRQWGKGLKLLRLRSILVFFLCLPQLWLLLASGFGLPLPPGLADSYSIQVYTSGILFSVTALLALDVWCLGLARMWYGFPGMDTVLAFAVIFTATDSFTMLHLAPRDGQLPYGCVVSIALFFALRGAYLKRRALRITCKTAASAQEPYLVTLDAGRWNGEASYSKHPGPPNGFGSQLQTDDGAQRIYRRLTPVLMIACAVLSLMASAGEQRVEYLPWCLSATFAAAASFGGLLTFSKPFFALAKRLSACGAALAGWDGVKENGRGILLSDNDLFPPGTVTINGIKVFGDISIEKVLSLTASLIRESGSGLERIFHDLLRSHGATYRPCTAFARYEGGGMSATVWGEQVLVGSASFMMLMDISLPQGLKVKNAVFCAVNGELAGIFALNYSLHSAISPALYALIQNKVSPVLATRDFNIIPSMLHQRFKLPVEKMDFPPGGAPCGSLRSRAGSQSHPHRHPLPGRSGSPVGGRGGRTAAAPGHSAGHCAGLPGLGAGCGAGLLPDPVSVLLFPVCPQSADLPDHVGGSHLSHRRLGQ